MSFFDNKTVLITGATGLIGSHIVDKLITSSNAKIIALGRNKEKLEHAFGNYINIGRLSIIAEDISQSLSINEKIDLIFHAAGPMEGKIIVNTPVDVINPNIFGLINCLNFLIKQEREHGIKGRIIIFSSVTVYGNNTDKDISVLEKDTNITESIDSQSACYSQSKRMIEVIANAYTKQYGVDIVKARFSTVYGFTRFIPETAFFEFIKCGIDGRDIVMQSCNSPHRDNIYVEDAVDAVLLLCEKGVAGESYNVSSNGDLRNFAAVDEIAGVIADVSNKFFYRDEKSAIKVSFLNEFTGNRKAGIRLNNDKLKALGWSIKISLEGGIRKTLELASNDK